MELLKIQADGVLAKSRHEVAYAFVVLEFFMTQPNVLPLVLYQDVRLEQSNGAKLLGQCSLIQENGSQTVRGDCDC
jgi:hypothetical protein